jgi:hypothetical protein
MRLLLNSAINQQPTYHPALSPLDCPNFPTACMTQQRNFVSGYMIISCLLVLILMSCTSFPLTLSCVSASFPTWCFDLALFSSLLNDVISSRPEPCIDNNSILELKEFEADTNSNIADASWSAGAGPSFVELLEAPLSWDLPLGDPSSGEKPVALITLPSSRDRMSVDCTLGRLDRFSRVEETAGGSFCG